MREPQERRERACTPAQVITKINDNPKRSTTRDQRRLALLTAMYGTPVLSFAGHLARTRARLDTDLLLENPDQQAQARLWGEAS